MNYYERHLGDYAKAAGHLTLLEHGAFTLLLDKYYTDDGPIQAEHVYRLCRARLPDEVAAVDAVLAEFFTLKDGKWHNKRAEEEISKAFVRISAARENGKRGGRKPIGKPKETQREPNGIGLGTLDLTQVEAHQAPSNHLTTKSKEKATVQPAAALPSAEAFDSFWSAYPNKKGKGPAGKTWLKQRLTPRLPQILAHISLMLRTDEQWKRGFIPMASTYLNQERWHDEPLGPTTDTKRETPKQVQALNNLQEMRNGLAGGRGNGGFPAFGLLGNGSAASGRGNPGDGNGLV